MKKIEQVVRLRKAGALVACTALMGSSSPALANGWGGNLPVAANVPIGHFPTAPTHIPAGHAGPSAGSWAGPGTNSNASVGHKSTGFLPLFGGHNSASINSQTNLWRGQAYLNSLPQTAAAVKPQSLFGASNGPVLTGPSLQLDLTSTTPSIVLGSNIFAGKQSVTIEIGGTKEVFSAGAHVTAAEYVAIRQVLGGKEQSLALSSQGAAVGGTFSVNSVSSTPIGELVVPSGVTALDYASKGNSATISGDILNYGTIYGVAARGQGTTVSINAQDIINENGGVISTVLTRSMASSVGSVMSPISLALTVADDISNAGRIVCSGSLSLTALNGSLTNALAVGSTAGGATSAGSTPTIQASHGISLSTGTGNMTNSGLISTALGNVSINSSHAANDININGAGGTIQAVKGDITVRDASYAGAGNINLIGGNYLSNNLNLYSGTGTITGNVGQVTGKLNTDAEADHLQVATADLLLGNNTAADPTFVNSAGDIEIVGTNTFGEDVAIIAKGSITAAADGQIVDHGNNVIMVAGAKIQSSTQSDDTGTVQGSNGTPPYPGSAQNSVTIDASSTSGGSINLSGSKVVNVIDTSSPTGNAGNVTLVAFATPPDINGTTAFGQITLANNSVINASAGGSGHGGNVTLIGGNNPVVVDSTVNAIQIGGINTGGGSAGGHGGNISLYTAQPTASGSNLVTFNTSGDIAPANSFVPGTTSPNASIQVNGDLVTSPSGQNGLPAGTTGASAGNITIAAGAVISTQNLLAFGGGGSGGDSVNLNGGAGGAGGNISISNSANFAAITINGEVNSAGGGGGGAGSNGTTGGTGGSGGNAGAIAVTQTGTPNQGQTLFSTSGGVFAAQGGTGGNASSTSVGGGGGSDGGGGGGGSSGTGGTKGTTGTTGSVGGGAGGAGFFGGGGGDVDGAGGGGGYTSGSAGGSQANATAGSSGAGGNGVSSSMTAPAGGVLGTSQQGGQGAGTGADGANIPTISGGNTINISTTGIASFGGDIAGSVVTIGLQGNLSLPGSVVGTTSITINDSAGSVAQAAAGLLLNTPSLSINLDSTFVSTIGVGTSTLPLSTNAQNILMSGNSSNTFISDSAASTTFDGSGLAVNSTLSIAMTANKALLDIKALPSTVFSLTLDVGSSATNGGTINFEPSTVAVGSPGATTNVSLTANNLTWTNSAGSALTISANNTNGSGGTIALTLNEVNGSGAITIGNGKGQLSLSATSSQGIPSTTGGSISLTAPTADLKVDSSALLVGYSDSSTAGNGGSITLNVGTIANLNAGALVLDASAAGANKGGSGNGGTVSVTVNTSNPIAIGSATGDIQLQALNGGTGSTLQKAGILSFTNLGGGQLTVDPLGLLVAATTGGATNVQGGSITLSANTVKGVASTLSINVDGVGNANGGKISVTETNTVSPASVTLGQTGDFFFSAQGGAAGGNGGSVTFSTQGALLLTTDSSGNVISYTNGGVPTVLSANIQPQFTNGNAGSLTLSASNFSNANLGAKTPLIFNAQGQGTGSGGHVRINQLDADTNLTVGTGQNDLEFQVANGASGTISGTAIITIVNNSTNNGTGTLFIDPAGIVTTLSSKTNLNVSGGFVELNAPTIAAAPNLSLKGALVINTSGVGNANAGDIIFEESNATSNYTIGTKLGQFEFINSSGKSGGFGGAILATSGGNLTVNPSGINVKAAGNGGGGFLALSALNLGNATDGSEGNLLVTGALSVNGAGKGTGGTISLTTNSTTPFNVGLSSKNTNGVEGSLSMTGGLGGSLEISSVGTGGIVIQTSITSPEFVTITSSNLVTGNVAINSTLGGTKTNSIIIAADGLGNSGSVPPIPASSIIAGNSGKLVTSTTGSIELNAQDTISGLTTVTKGVSTTKQLQIVTTTLAANSASGDIDINDAISISSTLNVTQMNTPTNINLSCTGSISTPSNSNGAFEPSKVNNSRSLSQVVEAAASGGSNTAPVTAGNNLSLNAKGTISGNYGGKNADVTVDLDGAKKPTQVINLQDYLDAKALIGGNKSVFDVSPANPFGLFIGKDVPSPDLNSAPSQSGNTLNILVEQATNSVGFTGNTSLILSGAFGTATSNVSVQTTAPLGTISGTALLSGKSVSLMTNGGDIGAIGSAIQTKTASLSVVTGNVGNAYVNNQGTALVTLTESQCASLNLTTKGGLTSTGLITSGDITLTSGATSTITGLNSAGSVSVTQTAGILAMSNSTASSNMVIASTGGANLTSLNADNGITITDKGKTTATGLTSGAGGVLISSSGTGVLTLSTVTTSNSGDIQISSGGTTTLSNLVSAGSIVATTGGATTLGNLLSTGTAADGNISVTNSSGALISSPNAKIFALNSSINLENANIKSGTITIGTGTDIETGTSDGTSFTSAGGQVAITIGPVPGTPVPGTAPSTVVTTENGGTIAWGANGVTAVVSKLGPNSVTANNANVIFNTGSLKATAIKLNGDTTIIADPPTTNYQVAQPSTAAVSLLASTDHPTIVLSPTGQTDLAHSNLPDGNSTFTSLTVSLPVHTAEQIPITSVPLNETAEILGAIQSSRIPGTSNQIFVQSEELERSCRADGSQTSTDPELSWISETELSSGFIPAIVSSERQFGICSGVSIALESDKPKLNCDSEDHCSHSQGSSTISRGSILFAPLKDVRVTTPIAGVNIAAKSVALVLVTSDSMAVYNFFDTHAGAVKLDFGGHTYQVHPGQHILITTKKNAKFEQSNLAQAFGYRHVNKGLVCSGAGLDSTYFSAEFDIVQAMKFVLPLRQLITSKNEEAKNLSKTILKTASIISELTSHSENYSSATRQGLLAKN